MARTGFIDSPFTIAILCGQPSSVTYGQWNVPPAIAKVEGGGRLRPPLRERCEIAAFLTSICHYYLSFQQLSCDCHSDRREESASCRQRPTRVCRAHPRIGLASRQPPTTVFPVFGAPSHHE